MIDYDAGAARRSVVLIADGPAARARAEAVAHDASLAVRAVLDVAEAADGRDAAFAADLIWVEVDRDGGAPYDSLLRRVAGLARGGRAVAVAIPQELIDVTDAALGGAPVALLCASPAAERLAIAETLLAAAGTALREEGGDRETQLRAIGTELTRIAERLVAVTGPGLPSAGAVVPAPPTAAADRDAAPASADEFRAILRRRRMRDLFLGNDLFADPAWDMLLDLAAARLEERPVSVSSLCIAAAVPNTTALRWIQTLTERELLVRTPDPQDGRRVFVTLAPAAARAMDAYVRHAYRSGGRVAAG